MTNEEAIRDIEECVMPYVGGISLQMAVDALKEQRPHGTWNDHSDEGYVECPFCDHATTCDDNIEELHYCFFCGASLSKKGDDANDPV